MMKKFKKYGILIIIAAIMGFLTSFLRHNFYLTKLITSLKSVHFLLYIPIIIFIFFLIILIHELGHLFTFVFRGIKIKALFVLNFILIKKKNRWKLTSKIKNLKMIGGLVVPIIPDIKTEEEYIKLKKDFSITLIMGPITSIIYFLLTMILFIIVWFYTNQYILITLLFFNFIIGLPMVILIHLSSKVNTNNIYGDYVAYKKFNEEYFSLLNIIQYYNFNEYKNKDTEIFLLNKLEQFINTNNLSYNLFDISLSTYFMMYILKFKINDNNSVNKVINFYNINNLASSEYGLELAYLISSYYYLSENIAKSYEVFNYIQIIKNRKLDKTKQHLLKLEYEHYLNIKDNKEEIYNCKDYILKEYDILEPLFNVEDELKSMTEKLDFKIYKTDIITFI